MKAVIIIPARLGSTRLPNKVLLDLNGKPLIQRTWEACKDSKVCSDIFIAVDDLLVYEVCRKFTPNVILTSTEHISGTSRMTEAYLHTGADIIVNVQGDEPFIDPATIDALANALIEDENVLIASAYSEIKSVEEISNPNIVKVVTDLNANAIYFSRFAIPYNRDNKIINLSAYKKHIGIYGYKREFLENFTNLRTSFLENSERLEQLRFLENGYSIKMIKVDTFEKGIDTEEDLIWARKKFEAGSE